MPFYVDHIIGDNNAEIKNMAFERLATEPSTNLFEGRRYYNTATHQEGVYNGTTWVYWAAGAELQANKNAASGYAWLSATFQLQLKNIAGTFISLLQNSNTAIRTYILQDRNGTLADDTDITAAKARANHTGTQLASTISDFASAVLATVLTGLSVTNSAVVATDTVLQAMGKLQGQINSLLSATTDGVVFKGSIDASANPNYPAADAGFMYKISVAGRIGGGSGPLVKPGDTLICNVDASSAGNHATVGSNWTIIQTNVDTATDTVEGLVELATITETETRTDTTRAVTPADLLNFSVKKTFTIGDGSTTSFVLTHNLNTQAVDATVRRVSDSKIVETGKEATSVNTFTVTFATAPATNSFVVTID